MFFSYLCYNWFWDFKKDNWRAELKKKQNNFNELEQCHSIVPLMFQQKDIALHDYSWEEEGQKNTLYLNQGYWTLKQTKKKAQNVETETKNYPSKYNDSEMKIRRRRRRRRPLLNTNCPRMKLSVGQKMSSTSHICSSRLKRKCQRNETAGHNATELLRLFLVNTAFLLKSILKIYQPFKLFF